MEDIRGIKRGECVLCTCDGFMPDEAKVICSRCDHPPIKHERIQDQIPIMDKVTLMCGGDSNRSREHLMDDVDDGLNTGISLEDQPFQDPFKLPLSKACKLPGCSVPCFVDQSNGEAFDFCCRSHGRKYQHQCQRHRYTTTTSTGLQEGLPSGMKCKNPKCSRQKYQDNEKVYDFCGHTCHDRYMQQSVSQQTAIDVQTNSIKCKNPQCCRQKHQDSDGKLHDFCGRTCHDQYMQLSTSENSKKTTIGGLICLLPGCELPRYIDPGDGKIKLFCRNQHKIHATSLVLLKLSYNMTEYQETSSHFIKNWDRNKSCSPSMKDICAIFQIFNPKQAKIFHKYATGLANSGVEQYYHGTSLKCDVLNQKQACTDNGCGLCGISRNGFDQKMISSNIEFMRFGRGFYLAPNSSKCHDYTQGIVDYRVMLLCDVAPGRKFRLQNDRKHLKAPPQGYDSVYGASGGNLNYDEIVMYCSESILPKYVIVYKRDGIGKIAS